MRRHRIFLVLLSLYLALAIWWNLATPLFEGPDAYYHFAVTEHISRTGTFPPKENAEQHPWQQMTYHAPLYYLASAALISPIDTGDFAHNYRLNTHAALGIPGTSANVNFIAHIGDPWTHTGLAVRVVRLFSSLLGALTLASLYILARLLLPQQPTVALLAVALVMFNPQFVFIHSIVSNDTLVTALSTLSLAVLVYLLRRRVTLGGIVMLAIILGLNALSKASGLVLYPPIILALLVARFPQRVSWRQRVAFIVIILAIGFIIAGWWYINNWLQLGDAAATTQIAQATGARTGGIPDLAGELRGMLYSFWGVFGWFNILAPDAFYLWVYLLLALSAAGILWACWHERAFKHLRRVEVGVFALYVLLFVGAWWRFDMLVNASQGRLLFPLIGIIALVLATGLSRWPKPLVTVLIAGFAFWTITLPALVIIPAFAVEPPVAAADWQPPNNASTFLLREPWQDESCLRLSVTLVPWEGGTAPVYLNTWWEAQCPVEGYWSVFLHFIDVNQETCVAGNTDYVLAQVDSMPLGGNLPLPALEPGKIYYERWSVTPPPDLDASRDWHVQLGLYDAAGSFMRAFVTAVEPAGEATIGQCAPETVQFTLEAPPGSGS